MNLVSLIKLCLALEISAAMLDQIDQGFWLWVEEYERWALFFVMDLTQADTGFTSSMTPSDFRPVL